MLALGTYVKEPRIDTMIYSAFYQNIAEWKPQSLRTHKTKIFTDTVHLLVAFRVEVHSYSVLPFSWVSTPVNLPKNHQLFPLYWEHVPLQWIGVRLLLASWWWCWNALSDGGIKIIDISGFNFLFCYNKVDNWFLRLLILTATLLNNLYINETCRSNPL